MNKKGETLYGVVTEKWIKRNGNRHFEWVPNGIVYVHAMDAAMAKFAYLQSASLGTRVIACAPAVGFHVEDEHGEKLRA